MHPRTMPALALAALLLSGGLAAAQELPVTKVALFSSGVGYFERRGTVKGDASVSLPFSTQEVDDVLKSLVVWDLAGGGGAAGAGPSVSYPSLETLDEALRGLGVDLRGNPRVEELLARLRGAELVVEAPERIQGRVVSVEQRPTGKDGSPRATVVLLTQGGVRAVALDDMASFRFADPAVAADFERGLALILGARDAERRVLDLRLPGTGSREAALGYVVAAPVWKASYRLDLSGDKPWFQGWAVVDNPSQSDWKDVSLTLVSGRPVSFIQNLYAPLRLARPVLPLSIAGTAEALTYGSGLEPEAYYELDELSAAPPAARALAAPSREKKAEYSGAAADRLSLAASAAGAAEARAAGDQFEFTIKRPVTLERRRSAMLPLVAGPISAEKVSIWSPGSGSKNPMLGARIVNSLGMKLPAGPVTVFDGGAYAGDALLEFLPEKDKRLVAYGQDLSVEVEDSSAQSRETTGVTVAKGVLVFSRRVTYTRTYVARNASAAPRKLLVEHPVTAGAELAAPASFEEKTGAAYRFLVSLPAGGQAKLEVKERSPAQERVVLSGLSSESFLSYASSSEIPAKVKEALRKAIELKGKAEDAKKALADLEARSAELESGQSRIRSNLTAVGRDSTQGQQYLKRLMDSEAELDGLKARIEAARKASREAQSAYEAYLGSLSLE